VLRALRAARRLRGTALDPFGRAHVRREERALVGWYEALLDRALARLAPGTAGVVAEIAALPDAIRGYEDLKLRSAAEARAQAERLLARLDAPSPTAAP
jgi:indolepyruvate ferredoxin oxidoreductase